MIVRRNLETCYTCARAATVSLANRKVHNLYQETNEKEVVIIGEQAVLQISGFQ